MLSVVLALLALPLPPSDRAFKNESMKLDLNNSTLDQVWPLEPSPDASVFEGEQWSTLEDSPDEIEIWNPFVDLFASYYPSLTHRERVTPPEGTRLGWIIFV